MITNELQNLSYIFNFSKIFYESYHKKVPLINFPSTLEKLINTDIIQLIKSSELHIIDKANIWMEEAYLNFERISKIGVEANKKLILELVPNKIQDCSFIQALTAFNERNYNIANCLVNKKSLIDNENLIKSQIKLDAFKGISLLFPYDEIPKTSNNTQQHQNQDKPLKYNLQIQHIYLDRFTNSLLIHTLDDSKEDLKKLLQGHYMVKPIKFSCPANSVIKFFRERHEDGVIINSKSNTKEFIHAFFLFKNNKTKIYQQSSLSNITNFLTRKTSQSGTLTKIIFIE
ncbi:hypothetical protein [Chryseobacterium nepalense]|uniref:Uncharacterized protein n=1 Tax=Chryseobacterium nepalense TaxID=1854498 RepID=A0ABY4K3H4_9FLAO|nr:hypothetical protein [Chryseobacterium nepalense]UPQ75289.1 hypothetical protein M0D58_14710 [Chryseobacterium nepalense]